MSNRKASLELSIQAIVIIVLAMTLLGLGLVFIKNIFGQAVGKINIPSTYVLANTNRAIPLVWQENFLLGSYTAYLSIMFDTDGPIFGRVISFYSLPLLFILGIILGIIVLEIIFNRVKSRLKYTR